MRGELYRLLAIPAVAGAGLMMLGAAARADTLDEVMKARGLTEKDVLAAAKTYVPGGKRDDFIAFSSGGQSGDVIVYGIPSMRILKYIAVFSPEPWQGYGFDDESRAILEQGKIDGRDVNYGDTHHPAISETNGEYDGQFLFINDKPHARMAVIDLKDFETKQIVVNPIMRVDHGGAFVSPNTDYVLEASQYPAPLDNAYAPLSEFNDKYRGADTFWKFDRASGRLVPEESFSIELPPYSQDLSDFGKGPSDGWAFTNSFCAERYVGGIEKGRPPFEAGCSQNDTDFLHVINWKKAAELVKAGKAKKINGHNVLPMDVAVAESVLFLVPETKSPHGADVTPDGKFIIVAGKLDTHATVFSWEKMQKLIDAKDFAGKDAYGIPILDMAKASQAQVSLGLGPLHTQYDSKPCIAYTSMYVDSQVAKWDYCKGEVLDKLSVHYNIGHLMTMEGDSMSPKGHYLVALDKLSIDRFNPVGPLHPQNHQLIDISGDKMELLYDMPLPLGEPHYAVAISASKLKPNIRYAVGTNSRTDKKSPFATLAGREHTEVTADKVEVFGTLIRSHFNPEIVEAEEGQTVTFHWTSQERAEDETHGFAMHGYAVNLSVEPGKTESATIKADKPGVYSYYCTEFCSALHLEMEGYLLVRPKGTKAEQASLKEGQAYSQDDYNKQVKTNTDTQAVIDSVVKFITERNFKDFPTVVALVEDATDQLNFAAEAKKKTDDFAAKSDWQNATLWAQQWFQYQVKAADIGLRAKTYLEQNGAKTVQ